MGFATDFTTHLQSCLSMLRNLRSEDLGDRPSGKCLLLAQTVALSTLLLRTDFPWGGRQWRTLTFNIAQVRAISKDEQLQEKLNHAATRGDCGADESRGVATAGPLLPQPGWHAAIDSPKCTAPRLQIGRGCMV